MFEHPTLVTIATIGAGVLLVILLVMLALALMWLSLVLIKRIQAELRKAGVQPEDVDQTLDALQGLPAAIKPLLDEPTDLAIILLAAALRRDPVAVVKHLEIVLNSVSRLTLILPELRDALGLNERVAKQAEPDS